MFRRLPSLGVAGLSLVLAIAILVLFRVEFDAGPPLLALRAFVDPPFAAAPGSIGGLAAVILAAAALTFAWWLGSVETAWKRDRPDHLRRVRKVALAVTCLLIPPFYFDLSLASDVLHYLTNIGPAMHLRHGGTLMVDTFSQYGPGPAVMTLIGFQLGPLTFGTAEIVVQIFNLAFYIVWIICLYRMSHLKLPALVLGFLSVAVFMAAWGKGASNVNYAPSVLGFRYLLPLLMVLALSCLKPPATNSPFVFASTLLAGLWSVEALSAALAIHIGFIGLLAFRRRAFARLVRDLALAIAPAALAVLAMSAFTLISSGSLPDYVTYLQFLTVYNPVSDYWSMPPSPNFFGWIPLLIAIFLVAADAWARIVRRGGFVLYLGDGARFYKFVPMALLTIVMSAYYLGRSVDYTLGIAMLPFLALITPWCVTASAGLMRSGSYGRIAGLLPSAVATCAVALALLAIVRQDGPYSLLINQCPSKGNCSASAIAEKFDQALQAKPFLKKVGSAFLDRWYGTDEHVVAEAVEIVNSQRRKTGVATLLLGPTRGWNIMSETAYLHTDSWDRWPRSFTFSDALIPALAKQIVDAPVTMRDGDLVVVRRDETKLGVIEAGILRRIRTQAGLCLVALPGSERLAAYVVAHAGGCQ